MQNRRYSYEFVDGRMSHRDFYSLVDSDPRRIQWLLRNHQLRRPVRCLCLATNGIYPEVHVCIRATTAFLRRSPGTHVLHAQDCINAEDPDADAGGGAERVPGIRREDDVVRIGVSGDLFPARAERDRSRVERVATQDDSDGGQKKRRISSGRTTLLGLLRFLLEEAEAPVWRPELEGRRTDYSLSSMLGLITAHCAIDGAHRLDECLVPATAVPGLDDLKAKIRVSVGGVPKMRELIVTGPLVAMDRTRTGQHRLRVGRLPPVFMTESDWNRCSAGFQRFLLQGQDGHFASKLWVLVTLRDPASERYPFYIQATNLAAVALSKDYIPIESSYEREFADYLVAQRRSFTKPIRYQPADLMFPDFVLHDSAPETFIEVLGFNESAYRARIHEKEVLCRREAKRFLAWDAVNQHPYPQLPPAVV